MFYSIMFLGTETSTAQ